MPLPKSLKNQNCATPSEMMTNNLTRKSQRSRTQLQTQNSLDRNYSCDILKYDNTHKKDIYLSAANPNFESNINPNLHNNYIRTDRSRMATLSPIKESKLLQGTKEFNMTSGNIHQQTRSIEKKILSRKPSKFYDPGYNDTSLKVNFKTVFFEIS